MQRLTRKPCKLLWRLSLLIGSKWIVASMLLTTSQKTKSSASREPSTWSVTFPTRSVAVKFAWRLTMSTCKCSSPLSTKLKPWSHSAARRPSHPPTSLCCWQWWPSSPSRPRSWPPNCLRWLKMDLCWFRNRISIIRNCILNARMLCSTLHSWLMIITRTHKQRLRITIAISSKNLLTRLPCKDWSLMTWRCMPWTLSSRRSESINEVTYKN